MVSGIRDFALIVAVTIVPFSLLGCDKVGDCQDAGGRWVEEINECECTYEDRGSYDIHITDEEYEACKKDYPGRKD